MADLLYRIGRACGGHPWRVVVVWTLVLAAAVSGYLAIFGLLRFVRTHSYDIFVIYRVLIGIGLLVLILTGVREATF